MQSGVMLQTLHALLEAMKLMVKLMSKLKITCNVLDKVGSINHTDGQ
jgi:hypothetical protein